MSRAGRVPRRKLIPPTVFLVVFAAEIVVVSDVTGEILKIPG